MNFECKSIEICNTDHDPYIILREKYPDTNCEGSIYDFLATMGKFVLLSTSSDEANGQSLTYIETMDLAIKGRKVLCQAKLSRSQLLINLCHEQLETILHNVPPEWGLDPVFINSRLQYYFSKEWQKKSLLAYFTYIQYALNRKP